MTTTESKMLDLEVGKIYKITDFYNKQYVMRVFSKDKQAATSHMYYCVWPHPDKNNKMNVGRYFQDAGCANKGAKIVYNNDAINTCVEISEDEANTIGWGNKYSNMLHRKKT